MIAATNADYLLGSVLPSSAGARLSKGASNEQLKAMVLVQVLRLQVS